MSFWRKLSRGRQGGTGRYGCERYHEENQTQWRRDHRKSYQHYSPNSMTYLGYYCHPCQNSLICKVELADVPFFNAQIYLENNESIGKIDEIFGTPKDYYVSVALYPNMKASSFNINQKFYIDSQKLLPLSKFLPQPKGLMKNPVGKNPNRYCNNRGGGRSFKRGINRRFSKGCI